MYSKLKQHILPQLIPPRARILVAVSGGPDSVALAHILWRYGCDVKENQISLVLTHIHHGVRQESDEEEMLVRDLARKWGIPCLVHRFNAKSYAKELGQSFQAAAREWRYARWKEDMKEKECSLLATAHHLGDQAETFLYRLLRGSGTAGLAGIYPHKRDIIRPLLMVSKEQILDYCNKEELPFALDQSNEEPIYARNKIRLELLPELEKNYNPRVQEALGRTAELLRWDEEYLSGVAETAWSKYRLKWTVGEIGLKREVFQEPQAILTRLIRKAAGYATGEPRGIGFPYVAQIMDSKGQVGWQQDLPGLRVHIDYKGIWFSSSMLIGKKHKRDPENPSLYQTARLGEWVEWKDPEERYWKMGLFKETPDISYILNQLATKKIRGDSTVFDRGELEPIESSLVWRNRHPGDTMWFRGSGHKSLKKVFQEEKLASKHRISIPLLAFENEVLWIPGIRRADRYLDSAGEKVIGLMIDN